MSPAPRLAGRLALVTGATRGIGRAVALAYAKEGAHLILVGRTAGALEEVDDEIRALGGNATLLTLDLKNHDKIDALGPTIYQRWQKLDILVGNAGILGPLSPAGSRHGGRLGRGAERQSHGQLAADPHARSAAAPVGRRTGDLRLIGRRRQPGGLLGPLRRLEGGAGGAGRYLRARSREHAGACQSHQSRAHAHEHARQGLSGRERRFAQDAGSR